MMASTKVAPVFVAAAAANNPLARENMELKKENAKLKAENEKLRTEVASLKKRKASTDASSQGPAKKAKTPAQIKKLFEKWSKALKRQSAKHKLNNPMGDLFTVTVKETTPWSMDDFTSLFTGGIKIQPLPDNKPTSTITILSYPEVSSIKTLFGETGIEESGYTVQNMRQRNFCKTYKRGDDPATLKGLEVHYNKSKQTLQLNFGMEHAGGW